MTILTCRKCGVVAQLFGHDALCDTCRLEKWARQRERLEATKAVHPAGKSAKRRRLKWFIDLSAERNFKPAIGEDD